MTSLEVKQKLIGRFTFYNGYVGAVYECPALNAADVIAVKHGGKIQEYEIKVSKSDLVGELRCARIAAGLDKVDNYMRKNVRLALDASDGVELTATQVEVITKNGHTLSKTKLAKHKLYLDPEHKPEPNRYSHLFTPPKQFVPNTFYWCIPYELLDVCKELNKGLPYGIYVVDLPQTSQYYQKFIVKPGRSLGGQGDRVYFELFNRACTLWSDSRDETVKLKRRIAELEDVVEPTTLS